MSAETGSVQAFIDRWIVSGAQERANKDLFLAELCDVLEVERPHPKTGDQGKDLYVFEKDTILQHEGGLETTGHIDLYKHGAFLLEAKQGSDPGNPKGGTGRRHTGGWALAMQDAFGQAFSYSQTIDGPPPFIIVCDIGYCFDLYASFDGSRRYRDYPNAQRRRIYFKDLVEHIFLLRSIWTDPASLDPTRTSAKITREVAGHIGDLARVLEERNHGQERVAQFLMRCLFTMFAEDVGLLPNRIFAESLEKWWIPNPDRFQPEVESFWRTMNTGGNLIGAGKIRHFNGGLFADPVALPLEGEQLARLLEAARCNWVEVEPSIFGTLLERALDPDERHNLGAHYTPRSFVERLVRPAVEQPLRDDWDAAKAEALQLIAAGQEKQARDVVKAYHQGLCEVTVLDPACGTGNFLYVTLDILKRLESEVLGFLGDLGESVGLLGLQGVTVTPEQFHGLEVKPWAKEIAELVLWIGYLQWELRTVGTDALPEPILREYHSIECRDAVLEHDGFEAVLGPDEAPLTEWDRRTTRTNPVTLEQIPDESARVEVTRCRNPRKAIWPQADFIVGNPPFIGNKKMRTVLGDAYVSALREVHDVPESADYVMYWWSMAACLVREEATRCFGLITTNSITQTFNRRVVRKLTQGENPIRLRFAIPDHPWIDSSDGAAVRIAMTVGRKGDRPGGVLWKVIREESTDGDEPHVEFEMLEGEIHPDLSVGADVQGAPALKANKGLCGQGMKIVGDFYAPEGMRTDVLNPVTGAPIVRRIINTEDVKKNRPGRLIIDFFGLTEAQAKRLHPEAYQQLLINVKPFRDQNKRKSIRELWWRFAWERPVLRGAIKGTPRYFVTLSTAKHRFFVSASSETIWDGALFALALHEWFHLGILSSRIHAVWSLEAGGTLEDRPTWTNTTCFDPFPFPVCEPAVRERIGQLAEEIDRHRKQRQNADPSLTLTDLYNVMFKLRAGAPLSIKEAQIHRAGLVTLLLQLHDELDAAAFNAYGWPTSLSDDEILERLVSLNSERIAEEVNGNVKWLRTNFRGTSERVETQEGLDLPEDEEEIGQPSMSLPWPKTIKERILAVRGVTERSESVVTVETVAGAFRGAPRKSVEGILEILSAMGLVVALNSTAGRRWKRADLR